MTTAINIKTLWRKRPACLNAGNALTAGLLLCLAYAFCRGFRMPNIWSTNYWLINFFDGFGRRALLGTLLYPFGEWRNHYHFIAAIQLAASAALLALIVARLAVWQRKNAGIPYIYIYIYMQFACRGQGHYSSSSQDILSIPIISPFSWHSWRHTAPFACCLPRPQCGCTSPLLLPACRSISP